MPEKTTREIIAGLFNLQFTGVLATEKGHQPYANLVAFSFTDDLRSIIFATSNKTAKYQNLIENPHVSIVIDSRKNNAQDFGGSMAITALGCGSELTGGKRSKMLQNHSARLPGLADFLKMKSIAIFEIAVQKYIITNGLDDTSVFVP